MRQRCADMPLVAEYFRAQFHEEFSKESEPWSIEMLQSSQKLDWPRNIREACNGMAHHVLIEAEAKIRSRAFWQNGSFPPGDAQAV